MPGYFNESFWLKVLLLVTFSFFIAGVFSPIITLAKFVFVENTFSVFSGIVELLQEDKYFLFFIIACFSLLLPLMKMAVILKLLMTKTTETPKLKKFLHWMHVYGKWSMLDVFIVAVLVVVVKLGPIASVEMHYGLYFFAISVVLTMLLTARVVYLLENKTVDDNNSNVDKAEDDKLEDNNRV